MAATGQRRRAVVCTPSEASSANVCSAWLPTPAPPDRRALPLELASETSSSSDVEFSAYANALSPRVDRAGCRRETGAASGVALP